jgi:phosphoglycerol transferase MdoB-like AlkP superfamily enzyme
MRFPRSLTRFLPAFAAAGVFVAVSTLTRVAVALRPEATVLGVGELARSFALGLAFDLVATAYAVTPLLAWLALAPNRLARTRVYRSVTLVLFGVACFGAVLLAVSEWLFWEEFGARFNFIAVDYLLYTHEVLGNIWESYPVGLLLGALALAAAGLAMLAGRALWRWSAAPLGWRRGLGLVALQAVLLAALTAFVDGDLKNRSAHDYANELAGNGLYEFFAANRRNELSMERYYATLPLPEALATVRRALSPAQWVDPGSESIERLEPGRGTERHLNVVLVSVESLGAEFLGAYGDARGLTPNLDRLARDSLWFANVYATGNRTVRGLEALALALPPTPGQSIVRRPNNAVLFSLGSVFEDKGYGVLFAYGGYGYFDNMNAFFDANDYRAVDRRDIPSDRIEFENAWGVADEHLYDQVIDEIEREKVLHPDRPVFAHVMTTSNHRPYTYPPGRIDIPSGTGREGAVKYSDSALGRLIERARTRPWFDDTVFVITADHGANARGTSQIPVDKYLIPVFVYAPKHVAPRRVDRLMSQIDIAPTLLGALDFSYYTKFLGRDVLHSPPATDRAFVANYQTLGYLRSEDVVLLEPKRKVEVFRRRADTLVPLSDPDPSLIQEAIAFYQVASHAFRNRLYLDEEQIPPGERANAQDARRVPEPVSASRLIAPAAPAGS